MTSGIIYGIQTVFMAYIHFLGFYNIEASFTSYYMWLMIEHNDDKYMALMSKLCCCTICDCFSDQTRSQHFEQVENQNKTNEEYTADTGDISVKMEHTKYEHGSELTVSAKYIHA